MPVRKVVEIVGDRSNHLTNEERREATKRKAMDNGAQVVIHCLDQALVSGT